jgi:hypothetical protein
LRSSEASVKRWFSRRDSTLQRLEDVCRIAGIDLADLARAATAEPAGASYLTVGQEQAFDRRCELFLFVSGMRSRRSTTELVARLRQAAADFAELHCDDLSVPLTARQGTSLLVAIRPWEPRAFRALRRRHRAPVPAGRWPHPWLDGRREAATTKLTARRAR